MRKSRSRTKQLLFAAMVMATLLKAGDPCPVTIDIYDDGIPPWGKQEDIYRRLDLLHPHIGVWIYDVTEDEEVLADGVLKNSPASRAGLKKDDRIVGLAGKKVGNFKDFLALLERHKDQKTV